MFTEGMTRRTGNNYSGARWAFSQKQRTPYVLEPAPYVIVGGLINGWRWA